METTNSAILTEKTGEWEPIWSNHIELLAMKNSIVNGVCSVSNARLWTYLAQYHIGISRPDCYRKITQSHSPSVHCAIQFGDYNTGWWPIIHIQVCDLSKLSDPVSKVLWMSSVMFILYPREATEINNVEIHQNLCWFHNHLGWVITNFAMEQNLLHCLKLDSSQHISSVAILYNIVLHLLTQIF